MTKVDKVSRGQMDKRMAEISRCTGLSADLFTLFSVPGRTGRVELWELIETALEPE